MLWSSTLEAKPWRICSAAPRRAGAVAGPVALVREDADVVELVQGLLEHDAVLGDGVRRLGLDDELVDAALLDEALATSRPGPGRAGPPRALRCGARAAELVGRRRRDVEGRAHLDDARGERRFALDV